MKVFCGLLVVFLVGCSASPSLVELEREAIMTGDWSAVEKREKVIARSRGIIGPECPSGYVKTCIEVGLKTECQCVKPSPGR